jgi:hypothetical protein
MTCQAFIPKLKKYLLPRILRLLAPQLYPKGLLEGLGEGGYTQPSWASVVLHNERVYAHQIMRARYTTYDVRQAEDIIRLKREPNVMVLKNQYNTSSATPPYRYARILGIFHADVKFIGSLRDGSRDYTPHRIEFLWVRWYVSCGYPHEGVWTLERLKFPPL